MWPQLIRQFRHYLTLERSLSTNSIEAYTRDVEKLADYVSREFPSKSPLELELEHLRRFVTALAKLEISAYSQARIISGIKAFYRFLMYEDRITEDPAQLLEAPKLGRKLPEVLTIEEIDALLNAIDLSKNEGHRNRAMLETLYSCGLRVSELVGLRFSDLFFEEGFIRVIGKGNKERLVPVSPQVQKEIDIYQQHIRNHLNIQKGSENIVFLNRRGAQLTRVMVFTIIKNLAESIGLKKNISPHTFRHSFATHLIEGGANLRAIQEMLGHESITTTEIYTHLDQRFLRDAILSYHPRNSKA